MPSFRLFSTPPGAPHDRRPTDLVLFGVGTAILLMAVWAADPPGSLSNDLTEIVDDSPEWVLSIWQVFFDLTIVWATLLVLFALLRRQFLLAATAITAIVFGVVLAVGSQHLALADADDLSGILGQLGVSEGPAAFPSVRLLTASAVLVVMSPAISRPYRFFGRTVVAMGFVASVGLGVSTLVGAIAGLAAGTMAAAGAHLIFGSPGGRPSPEQVREVLDELGVRVDHLEPALFEPAGVVLMDATHVDGRRLTVKVYGRDAWDGQLIAKVWRALWYRNGQPTLLLSRLHQVEHEALLTVLAERAGAPVPEVLVAGAASRGDAAVVTTANGPSLAQLLDEGVVVSDRTLADLWSAVGSAHRSGIVNGGLDLESATLDDAGDVRIGDWSSGSVAASIDTVDQELAQLLVLAALATSTERAVASAASALGDERLGELVPYLQLPALTSGLRDGIKSRGFEIDTLRDAASAAAGIDDVELVQLRRVTVKSVLSLAVVAVAAMLLISSLSDIGIETIVDELSTASWGWVAIALVVAQIARVWNAVGTTGATNHPLRMGPTIVLEFAITFVNLVIPSTAARIATKMRYFQKSGMTITAATAMSGIDALAGFIVQISVLASTLLLGLGGVEFDFDVDSDGVRRLVLLVAVVVLVLVVVGAIVLAASPSVRQRVLGPLRQLRESLQAVRSPSNLLRLLGGNAMAELTFASVLGLSLLAYGESVPILSLLVVNVGVALFAGVMPVPGGVGVTEAALTAGLVAIGVPEATAFAAAITTRMCTFYLPPIWGYFAMRWLRSNQYL
jgi:uncharacterized membrane protein YbhN (UPF0104 family)